MATRRFGNQIAVNERKVLGALPVNPRTGLVVKPVANPQAAPTDFKNFLANANKIDQENQENGPAFKIDRENVENEKPSSMNVQDMTIDLTDDQDTSTDDDFTVFFDVSKIQEESFSVDDEDLTASSEMEHSDCSLAPASPFTSLDCYQDFSADVLKYCLAIERNFLPDVDYMNKQVEINGKMRAILVDWLVDVCDEYNLHAETLFIAINYVDRYLSRSGISRSEFQLLGISALFIAAKYEEIYPPELHEFAYTTDDSATKSQILAMEKNILRVLNFDVSTPTAIYFLKKYAVDLNVDKEVYYFAKYICTLSLMDTAFLEYLPSEVAIASLHLSLRAFNMQFPDNFVNNTIEYEGSLGIRGDVISLLTKRSQLVKQLTELQQNSHKLPQQSIVKKYSSSKYSRVAKNTV